ncbi:MAG: Lipoprotein [Caballeronia sp.]|jgi:Raf kinase inhibitor-like YbhB/YbcL family protein|nr:Lipoprotein [Caballeronia sp.]
MRLGIGLVVCAMYRALDWRVVGFRISHRAVLLSVFCAAIVSNAPRAVAEVKVAAPFTLTSTDFRTNQPVPLALVFDQSDCKGGNRSPQLSWHGAPAATQSFAVTVFDPDAPGRGWWHWAVAGIPANVSQLPSNASASGVLRKMGAVESRNDFDIDGYAGPCPPPGKPHRYIITVYALNSSDLRLRQSSPSLMFEHEIRTTTIASAQLVVTYGR